MPCCGCSKSKPIPYTTREAGPPHRVALLASGTRGDHQPLVPFTAALQQRGCEVRIFSKETYRDFFEEFDIGFAGSPGIDFEHIFTSWPVRAAMRSGSPMLINLAINNFLSGSFKIRKSFDATVQTIEAFRPSVIIWHMSLCIEAAALCRLFQCPGICLAFFPFTPTKELPPFPVSGVVGKASSLNKLMHCIFFKYLYGIGHAQMLLRCHCRCKHSAPANPRDFWSLYTDAGRATICAWSSAIGPRPKDYHAGVQGPVGFFQLSESIQKAKFSTPGELEQWLDGKMRESLVYIGWGSMGAGSDAKLCKLAVGALRLAFAYGVVQGSSSDLRLEKLKDPALRKYAAENVYFVHKGESIPHSWLLPRCGAAVHHGGAGTVATCLMAGTPSIVTPVFLDQYYWAHSVQQAGVGLRGPKLASATPESLGSCIEECLKDLRNGGAMASSAEAVAKKMEAEDGPSLAAEFVQKFCTGQWAAGVARPANKAIDA